MNPLQANYYDLKVLLDYNHSNLVGKSVVEGRNFTLILAIGSRF